MTNTEQINRVQNLALRRMGLTWTNDSALITEIENELESIKMNATDERVRCEAADELRKSKL